MLQRKSRHITLPSLTQVVWVYVFVQRYCPKMEQQKQLTCVFFFLSQEFMHPFFPATHGFSAGLFQSMLMEISLPLSLPIPKALPKSVSPDEKQLRKQLKGTKWPGRVLSPRRPCLPEKGPSLLTSINPPNCVVGGSSWGVLVSWSVQCSLILCDLGDVQREK